MAHWGAVTSKTNKQTIYSHYISMQAEHSCTNPTTISDTKNKKVAL